MMKVQIFNDSLFIAKSSLTDKENILLDKMLPAFPVALVVHDTPYSYKIAGSKKNLFDVLSLLSDNFDVEL